MTPTHQWRHRVSVDKAMARTLTGTNQQEEDSLPQRQGFVEVAAHRGLSDGKGTCIVLKGARGITVAVAGELVEQYHLQCSMRT